MTLEDKMKRNIEQLEKAGMCPLTYFADKGIQECKELMEVFETIHYEIKMFGHVLDSTIERFYDEIPDVLNVCLYPILQYELDKCKMKGIQVEKVDRGYERGVK